jgi:predicted signal transduction protein with EAL and GGDEF domain
METEAGVVAMQMAGARFQQGYYFARPAFETPVASEHSLDKTGRARTTGVGCLSR